MSKPAKTTLFDGEVAKVTGLAAQIVGNDLLGASCASALRARLPCQAFKIAAGDFVRQSTEG